MKTPKYQTVRIVPKYNGKISEIGKFDIPNTKIHDHSSL
jgi:hypothetical protein